MTTTISRFNGYSLSSFICGILASVGNLFALILAFIAQSTGYEALFGLAGVIMIGCGLVAAWAVTGGIIALNTAVQRVYAVIAVSLGGLNALWTFACVVLTAAN